MNTIKSSFNDISCFCSIADDIIVCGGRFSTYLEFYRVSDKSILCKIDTETSQGVKCLLFIKKEREDPG